MVWEPSNQLEAERLEKLQHLRSAGIDPYPNRVKRTHTTAEAVAAFETVEAAGGAVTVTVCGRIVRRNIKGKVSFMHIEDGAGRLQLFVRVDSIGEAMYTLVKEKAIELGDFVQATGTMMRTKTGEVSVNVGELVVLAKALSPLPVIKQQTLDDGTVKQYGEFSDPEERYRQRYADLAVNPDVREIFRIRARTLAALRRFLDDEGFLEVETPILQPIYGGAAARPFVTHHNQLHQDLYLRISFELYLKRLMVGMYDGVYEIGRDFRNEGVSRKHNPEFTQLEFYKAYIDYYEVMDLAERLVSSAAERVTGSTRIAYQGHEIDFAPPWRRVTLRDITLEHTGVDYMAHPDAEGLRAALRAKGRHAADGATWGRLVNDMLDYAEPHMMQPHIVIDYPRDISPLAKVKPDDSQLVERFEFFIGGLEIGNAFTEINDPLDQEQRFIDMGRLYAAGDEDAHPIDEDYLRAMRYGMPPNGGFGMGVDRLVMLFADLPNIREALLFPHLREAGDAGE
ncbi:MAG: lysine--tRNA ligase [Anaerolineae bacterium]|nr:lysine--tRNA ligase [Anaerolineae bacterium]